MLCEHGYAVSWILGECEGGGEARDAGAEDDDVLFCHGGRGVDDEKWVLGECEGGGEAGDAGADDGDVLFCHGGQGVDKAKWKNRNLSESD